MARRPGRVDRAALCRAARRGDRRRAARLLFCRDRGPYLRHADRPSLGPRFRRRHFAPSGAALRSDRHGALSCALFVPLLRYGVAVATRAGFHLFVGAYAAQRFPWEFIKPYGTVIGPFNLFHLICVGGLFSGDMPGATARRPNCARWLEKAAPLCLSRSDDLDVRDLPALVPAKILEAGRRRLVPEALRANTACRRRWSRATRDYWKRCRDFLKPGDLPLQFQTRDRQGLPLRLRPLPRSRAAQLPGADRDQRDLQPDLPDLLCRLVAGAPGQLPLATVEAHARHPRRERRRARPAADQRRRADPPPRSVCDHRRRQAPQYPPRHAQHQRHPDCAPSPILSRALAECMPRFEIYLQFDALSRAALQTIRGADLRRIHEWRSPIWKRSACRRHSSPRCAKASTTTRSAMSCAMRAQWHCVRGVNFQPVQDAGRNDGFEPDTQPHRIERDPPRDPRPVGGLWRGRHDPAAVQSRGDFDRLRAARRHDDPAGHAPVPAGNAGARGAELGHLREPSRDAGAPDRAVVPVLRRPALGRGSAGDPVLPADGRAAGRRSATTRSFG